jgi:hypothetical protein
MTKLLDALRHLDWAGAVLGAVVSGVFAGSWAAVRLLWNKRPLRRFLDDLADERKTLSVFVRDMVSADQKYYSVLPNGQQQQWQNFPVVGRTDVEAATDVLNLLGQAGKSSNIAWRQINRDWDMWSDPLVCLGGSFKADKVLELCQPKLVHYALAQAFVTIPDNKRFEANGSYDYGLIYRGRHPETGSSCLVLFGFGMAGTEATGSYLRRNARLLARLYGSRSFAAIVRVGWLDGRDSGVLAWLSPGGSFLAAVLHFPTWCRHRKLMPPRSVA